MSTLRRQLFPAYRETLLDRLSNLENHLSELCNHMASYARKIAKTRDEGDALAGMIMKFGKEENINANLRFALNNFAEYLSAVQDWRDIEINQLEGRIVNEMSIYGELCRKAKEETRKGLAYKAKHGEMTRSVSTNELPNSVKTFELQIDRFEQRKLADLKRFFREFAQIELFFHAKSVELFSKAYKEIIELDEKSDLNSFRNHFGIRRPLSPVEDPLSTQIIRSNPKISQSLRRFSSSPEVNSQNESKKTAPKVKIESSDTEDEAEDLQNEDSDLEVERVVRKEAQL